MSKQDRISYKRCSLGKYRTDSESGLIASLRKGRPSITGIAGRTVLLDVFQLLGLQKADAIAIPAFYPQGLVIPIRRFGLVPFTYSCDKQFAPQIADIDRINSKHGLKAIIAIHFFGLKMDLSMLDDYCQSNGIFLIEDCAQALDIYSGCEYCYNSIVLYSFTKFLSVPDGAMAVYSNCHARNKYKLKSTHFHIICGKAAVLASLVSLKMCTKAFISRYPWCLKLILTQIAKMFYGLYYLIICNISSTLDISSFSAKIIGHIDYKRIFEMRERNTQVLIDSLVSLPKMILRGSSFGVIVVCKKREATSIIKELVKNGIYPMQFKSGWYLDTNKGNVFQNLVVLPVGEHLGVEHMHRIISVANGAFT